MSGLAIQAGEGARRPTPDGSRRRLERLDFDSAGQPDSDTFEAYRDLYRSGTDVSRIGDAFEARLRAWRLPRLLLFDRVLAGLSHERTAKRVHADGFDHVMVQLVLEGRMLVSVNDMPHIVEPGGMVAFDLTRPQRTWTYGSRIITVSLGRDLLAKGAPTLAPLHGCVLPQPTSDLLGDVVRSLLRNVDRLDAEVATAAAVSIGTLLGSALGSDAPITAPVLQAAKFEKALRFIDANLGRSDLSADTIGEALGLSRSVLYRMFEPLGGVACRIRRRRLIALRKALASAAEGRPIIQLARSCGFATDSHANRLFNQEFGITPGGFRASIQRSRLPVEGGEAATRDLHRWIGEIL